MSKTALVTAAIASLLGVAIGYAVAVRGPEPGPGSASPAAIAPGEAGARAAEILAEDDLLRRAEALAHLLRRAEPEALPALRAAFEGAPIDGGDVELVLLASWWAGFDPRAAAAWASTDWRARYASVQMAVYRAWAHREPREALAHARGLRGSVQREMGVEAAWVGWDEAGPPGLLEEIRSLEALPERQAAAQVIAHRRVATLGAEGALRWAEALPADPFRAMLKARIASAAAWLEPAVAASWVEPQITAGDERPSGLARRVGTRWVRSDPTAALAWLESLPAGEDRDDGVSETFRDWLVVDREAAVAWIEARPADPMEPWLEPAFAIYARVLARERPREALELAGRLGDETLRNTTTTVVVRKWLRNDPEAAEAWLAEADIPEGVRKRARMRVKLPRGPRARRPGGA